MSTKLGQLVISPESKSGPIGKILISQPSMAEEEILGRLFVVAEIQSKRYENLELVNFLFSQLEQNYYSSDKLALIGKSPTITPEAIFESAVTDLNHQINQFLSTGNTAFSPETASITIGVIADGKLYFANIGNNKALLIYEPKTTDGESKGYSMVNITKRTSDPTQEIFNAEKLFTNIIKGAIPLGSVFVFTNEALFEFLAEKQLIKIVTTLPPAGAAKQFRNILEQSSLFVPFLALIIKNQKSLVVDSYPSRPNSTGLKVKVHSASGPTIHQIPSGRENLPSGPERDINKESIRALNQTEARTAEILRPTGLINLTFLKKLLGKFKSDHPKSAGKKNRLIIGHPESGRHKSLGFLKNLANGAVKAISLFIGITVSAWQIIAKPDTRESIINAFKEKRSKMTKRHFIALGIVLLSLVALSLSIVGSQQKKAAQLKMQQAQQINDNILKKYDDLASALIYNNRDLAKANLKDIESLITQLPNTTPDDKKALSDARQKFQKAQDGIYNIIRVEASAVLPDSGGLSALWPTDNGIFALAGRSLVKITNFREPALIADIGVDSCLPINGSANKDLIYCLAGADLLALNLKLKTVTKQPISDMPVGVNGGGLYNGWLYLVAADKMIYRFAGGANGWSGKIARLSSPIALTAINGMIIDNSGSIYVAGDSTLAKYRSGKPVEFSLEIASPDLIKISALATGKNDSYIAIGEAGAKRILIYGDTGQLVKQYISDAWSDLKTLAISDKGDTLYALTGGGVYKLSIK